MRIQSGRVSTKPVGQSVAVHHAERVQSVIRNIVTARLGFVALWQRSVCLHGLQPQSFGKLLIRLAQSVSYRQFLSVGGTGCFVLLADNNGVPVEWHGAAGDNKIFMNGGCGAV